MSLLKPSAPAPGLPDENAPEGVYYTMHYRHGMNSQLTKNFFHVGNIASARVRAEAHAVTMGYRLIWVSRLIANLDEEESKRIASG